MAETYSSEYTASYITSPPGNTYGYGGRPRRFLFNYTQVLAGAANDTILLARVPPYSTIDMVATWIFHSTFTSGAQLDLGWAAYIDGDGVAVVADPNGLMDSLVLTSNGYYAGGMHAIATPDDFFPIAPVKVLNNRNPVNIYATITDQAPGVGAILIGALAVMTP